MLKFKKYPILKWSLTIFLSLIIILVSFGLWFMSLLPSEDLNVDISKTQPKDLPYLSQDKPAKKGKILAVVTSCGIMGSSGKKTGYELTELSRAYYVFMANGFEVDIASIKGGSPPVIIDSEDMGVYDYAFLNDSIAQQKVLNTIPIEKADGKEYDAVYFAGGKGTLFDFPNNVKIQSMVRDYYESGKVIGAVCHGPAAFVNVTLEDGSFLLSGKEVCSFTNEEELFLIPDAENIFPFLLEDELIAKGAYFKHGYQYLENICSDGNLLTGQNPWSTWALAEAMVKKLGYNPIKREITSEENTIDILLNYEKEGYRTAKNMTYNLINQEQKLIDLELLAVHGILAAMQWKLGKFFDMIRLLKYTNNLLN